jgi:hypothetical protein
VDGEGERRHGSPQLPPARSSTSEGGRASLQQPEGHRVQDHGGGHVEEEAGQVIAERIEPPEVSVDLVGHPGDRHVVPEEPGRPGPAELRGPKPTKLEVAEEHPRVVPGDEPVCLLRAGTNVKKVARATTAGTVSCQRRLAG